MKQRFSSIRPALIDHMVDAGELIRRGDDLYEDMGGHIVHECNLDSYISEYMNHMDADERWELIRKTDPMEPESSEQGTKSYVAYINKGPK